MEKRQIEEEVNKTIELFERSEQIEANPFFYSRLKTKLENLGETSKANLFGLGNSELVILFKTVFSQVLFWIKTLVAIPKWKWAVGALTMIFIVVGIFYVTKRFSKPESTQSNLELSWKSNMNDSIEVLSQSISRLQESPIFLTGTASSATISSASTLDTEISALKKQITNFSSSLSDNSF